MKKGILATSLMFLLVSCHKEDFGDLIEKLGGDKGSGNSPAGFVYTMSNETGGNSILVYSRKADGTLSYQSSAASGGTGSGAGLGAQRSVIIDAARQWLYAVNAGSNSISSFKIGTDGKLTLAHTVSSYGVLPVSVTADANVLYVVNSLTSNISGYTIGTGGALTPIEGSVQALSADSAAPAQISFVPGGHKLVVTEKTTNMITSFPVDASGVAGKSTSVQSAGQEPFGFDFSGANYIIVSEAWNGTPNASTVSSYSVAASTTVVSGAVTSKQTAACWAEATRDGQYAYIANAQTNNISLYQVNSTGMLDLLNASEAATGLNPHDMALSDNEHYFYNLNTGSHSISQFKRESNGSLKEMGEIKGLPAHADGLAAF